MESSDSLPVKSPVASLVFAVLLPVIIHSALTVAIAISQRRGLLEGTAFGITSMIGSAIIGFTFLPRQWRRYALPLGLVYFPAMIALLIYLSLILQGNLLGNWL